MQRLTSAPNHVGSAHDKANAEFIRDSLRDWGWQAEIETFSVLYPTPKHVSLEMISPERYSAKLREPPVAGDSTSSELANALPPYNVFGADGDVTADVVYVNQGMPADYLELERQGVSAKGKIVLTRYGGGWRGLKPKLAYEHGAVGCLIYSDPHDDGYGAGDTYPKGGYRPADSVQRGSVQDMVVYPGDPLTPGVGATAHAKRLAIKDARTILKIPVMPISYADASPLLAQLAGPTAPVSWRGGLPLAYHVGPGPTRVHMSVESEWTQKTLYDVIAKITGSEEPDHWVIRGNHHDAWVFGAMDPMAGHVALMAEAKSIGQLLRSGWRPKRTLVYASWDGEEPGLIGSTEWVEAHAAELSGKAILYVNSDTNGRGAFEAAGSQGLSHFVSEIAASVKDPETGATLLARALAVDAVNALENGGHAASENGDLPLGALGSGSDYTPFLQHLGISSLNSGFTGEDDYGVYHSAYDSFDHFRRFVDPTFDYGAALAQTAGRMVLRAAQADLIPMRAQDFASATARYTNELHQLADQLRAAAQEQDRLQESGAFKLASDPAHPRGAPAPLSAVPHFDFAVLDNAIDRLKNSARRFDDAYGRTLQMPASAARRQKLNDTLANLESSVTDARGLPGRDWFKHMIYAPGFHTGYGVKTLPGAREAIEERRWDEANRYLAVVAGVLNAYSAKIEQAAAP
jgi:N-acetylated-alpha-linked acidic dipeptidase